MNRVIEITVSPTGESRLETKGFVGSSCQEASRLLEQALGRVTEDRRTPEFFIASHAQNHEQQRE